MIYSPLMEQAIMAREYRYTAVFEPAEEGGFVVTFPALPGLITEGDSLEHARTMAAEALHGYLESLAKDGATCPAEDFQHSMPLIREPVTTAF
jgi:predicted RNase H-like HicB family nuclease